MITPESLAYAMAHPTEALEYIDKLESEASLIGFIRNGWAALEPGAPFVSGWAVEATCEHLQAVTDGEIKRLLINVPPGCTKPIYSATPVLTTKGWKRHGDLRAGDYVFGLEGDPKLVEGVDQKEQHESFRLVFNDGSEIIAAKSHTWRVFRHTTSGVRKPIETSTEELIAGHRGDCIPVSSPVQFVDNKLPIDPYLLGAWLGDGTSREGVITCTPEDSHYLATNYPCQVKEKPHGVVAVKIDALYRKLRLGGLLKNKHIPEKYLTSSIDQRWELLRGLMDTDGTVHESGAAIFVQKDEGLMNQVKDLVVSLGMKTKVLPQITSFEGKRFKSFRITFYIREGDTLFHLRRKQEKLKAGTQRTHNRYLKKLIPVGKKTVNCIQVQDKLYLVGKDLICTRNSMTTSVYWPAYEWGPRGLKHLRYILAAHEQNLAIRDNVRSRDLMQSEWYQHHWDEVEFKGDVNSKIYYENMATGWRMASSVGSGLTGYRGDRLILDDPHSIKKADSDAFREEVLRWFSETLPTRLNKPSESAIVVIMQRVHERDVSGLILAEELGYEHLMLPMEFEADRACYSKVKPKYIEAPSKVLVTWNADSKSWLPTEKEHRYDSSDQLLIKESATEPWQPAGDAYSVKYLVDPRKTDGELLWPERFDRESTSALQKALRAWGGSYAEAGQLQQRPAPRGGGMFQKDDFVIVDKAPEGGRTVRGWDLAATENNKKAPYTVGLKMRLVDAQLYILDVDRRQAGPSAVEKMIKTNAQIDGFKVKQDLPQDPGQAGKTQKMAIGKLLHGFNFVFSPESGSKEDRAIPFAAQVEVGNVHLVKGDWNQAFLNEASLFPNGMFKDQIDAATRAYSNLLGKRRKRLGAAPRVIKPR